jgi:hypothetical protein
MFQVQITDSNMAQKVLRWWVTNDNSSIGKTRDH